MIMKNIKYLAIGALVALSLTSCDKDTEGLTDVLYYPVITVEGPQTVLLTLGDTYEDPGYTASLGDEDYTSNVQVSTNLDTSSPGFYTVTYSVANPEGFSATATREVWVNNPGHFNNIYWAECWHATNASRHYYDSPVSISAYDASQGLYIINDVLAGYYAYGIYPQYRNTYDFYAEALLLLEGEDVTMLEEGDWYFYDGDDPEVMYDGHWDSATGVVTYRLNYYVGGGVILTPIE
jgi:hypothetical protein